MIELQQKIAKYFLRRRKEEVLKELPKKIYIEFPVKLDKETWSRYVIAQTPIARISIASSIVPSRNCEA